MKGHLLINKMQSQFPNPWSVLNCCLYCDRSFANTLLCLSYECMQSCVIHNSFALYGGDIICACPANKAECQ